MKKKDEGTGLTFQAYLAQEVGRVKGHYYTVHAPFLQRILTRETAYGKLHPNPEDEFCNPEIGPNYGIVAQYEQEFRQDIQFRTGGYEERSILEPLIVQKPKSSCGCTVPSWPKEPILPGESDVIKVTYRTNRVGVINKSVTVTSNAVKNGTVVLRIKGKVLEQPTEAMPEKETGIVNQ